MSWWDAIWRKPGKPPTWSGFTDLVAFDAFYDLLVRKLNEHQLPWGKELRAEGVVRLPGGRELPVAAVAQVCVWVPRKDWGATIDRAIVQLLDPRPAAPPPITTLRYEVHRAAPPGAAQAPLADGLVAVLVDEGGGGVAKGDAAAFSYARLTSAAEMVPRTKRFKRATPRGDIDVYVADGGHVGALVLEVLEKQPPGSVALVLPLGRRHWLAHVVGKGSKGGIGEELRGLAQELLASGQVTPGERLADDLHVWHHGLGLTRLERGADLDALGR